MVPILIDLPQELVLLRDMAADFVRRHAEPRWREIERDGVLPPDLLAAAGELGLFGVNLPAEYGGAGLGELAACIVLKELAKTSGAVCNIITPSATASLIALAGSEEQKRRWLPQLASGATIGAFCMTEPEAGSDAASIQTRAVLRNGRWVLNGRKVFITRARLAGLFAVSAVTDADRGPRGISIFLVERDNPGLHVSAGIRMMGQVGAGTAEVALEDCEVAPDAMLGPQGEGFAILKQVLARGRLWVASRALGAGERSVELAVEYARTRRQFGRPIGEFGAVEGMIADIVADMSLAATYTFQTAARLDRGEDVSLEASIAKLRSSEAASRAADAAIQIHGAVGYAWETGVERFWRDARAYRILEGTSEIQRRIIARKTLKLSAR